VAFIGGVPSVSLARREGRTNGGQRGGTAGRGRVQVTDGASAHGRAAHVGTWLAGPMQEVRHQPKEQRRLWASWLVVAERRVSPFRCATGCFEAPSTCRWANDACCRRAFSEARFAHIVLKRPLQKLGVML